MTAAEYAPYKLFAYERELAARELEALLTSAVPPSADPNDALRGRATYFHRVEGQPTEQALTEALHHTERGSRTSRQATRYLVHGLHEYKGKFNPQMARALINSVDPTATALMDPYCGSGTTLVEGRRLGLTTVGIDQNPLAAWMSQIKANTLELAGTPGLVKRFDALAGRILNAAEVAHSVGSKEAPDWVDEEDEAYLKKWFPAGVLAGLWAGLALCRQSEDPLADVTALCLSNIVRQVSWQLPEDLRVRRRPPSWVPPLLTGPLSKELNRARLAIAEVEAAQPLPPAAPASVHLGSSRDSCLIERVWPAGRRLVVTSPPYATALPYIDTDRLSIVLLGLSRAGDIRQMERHLTGSREWITRDADYWTRAWTRNERNLPDSIIEVLSIIQSNNERGDAGFRRRAVPPLLYRYFSQMAETLDALRSSMRPGEHVVLVVGTNRTGTGAQQVQIQTPTLLGDLASCRGYDFSESIPFQTWARYGMHSKNGVNGEDAVILTVDN